MAQPSWNVTLGARRRLVGALAVGILLVLGVAFSMLWRQATIKPPPAHPDCPPNMVALTGGRFTMGSLAGTPFEREHPAQVSAFCIDRTEVTASAYAECSTCSKVGLGGPNCNFGQPGRELHPMNCLTWQEAHAYCAAVGKRLPTEQEWEHAARGGAEGRMYPWGAAPPDESLACWKRAWEDGSCKVGSFPPGAYGLYDMVGGVSEWVEDWRGPYPAVGDVGYRGPPSGRGKMHRGGSWRNDNPVLLSGVSRESRPEWNRLSSLGFRCAKGR